jgi:GNAT superfamily N-acetyltransferase
MAATPTLTAQTIVPFDDEHLDGAALLLAERHHLQRLVEPGLDPRYEDASAARAEIDALRRIEGASGVAAVVDGDVAGYLIGVPKDPLWGPNVWVEPAGHATAHAELVRDLYAAAAQQWVDGGRTSHYTMVPATDAALVDAWFRLGFGHQHVHGIRGTPSLERAAAMADGLELRRPRRDDLDALARIDLVLPEHQSLAPVFSRLAIPTHEETRAELEDDFDDPKYTTFVVERDGELLGAAVGCAIEVSSSHAGLARPNGAAFLGFAAVLPEHRGSGAGRVLGEAVLDWARQERYATVVTDWRMTNLLASRTWPRLGFRPTFYRLFRAV